MTYEEAKKITRNRFYDYKEDRKMRLKKQEEIIDSIPISDFSGEIHGSSVSNPTEAKALKLERINEAYAWCDIVERTLYKYRDTDKARFIRYKYIDKLSERKICEKLFIERAEVYRMQDAILNFARTIAAEENLFHGKLE